MGYIECNYIRPYPRDSFSPINSVRKLDQEIDYVIDRALESFDHFFDSRPPVAWKHSTQIIKPPKELALTKGTLNETKKVELPPSNKPSFISKVTHLTLGATRELSRLVNSTAVPLLLLGAVAFAFDNFEHYKAERNPSYNYSFLHKKEITLETKECQVITTPIVLHVSTVLSELVASVSPYLGYPTSSTFTLVQAKGLQNDATNLFEASGHLSIACFAVAALAKEIFTSLENLCTPAKQEPIRNTSSIEIAIH